MKSTFKTICASALALSLAFCGCRDKKSESRGDPESGESSGSPTRAAFKPMVGKDVKYALGVNLDKEQAFKIVDACIVELVKVLKDEIANSPDVDEGNGSELKEKVIEIREQVAACKEDPFKNAPEDLRALLDESGLRNPEIHWGVLALENFKVMDNEPQFKGLSLAIAGKVDLEKLISALQRKFGSDLDFEKTMLEGERTWHVVPSDSSFARGLRKARIDPYVTSLDGQLLLVAGSRETLVKQILLYRKGEGRGDLLHGFSAADGECAHLRLSGVGDMLWQYAPPRMMRDLVSEPELLNGTLEDGKGILLGLKDLVVDVRARSDGLLWGAAQLGTASSKDADQLRTFAKSRRSLVAKAPDVPACVKKMVEDMEIGGETDQFEISNVNLFSLALGAIFPDVPQGAAPFSFMGERDAYLKICANEILDRMGTRTWLITDGFQHAQGGRAALYQRGGGLLDKYLLNAAKARGKELHIITIGDRNEQDYAAYCNRLADLVMEKNVTAGKKTSDDLAFTLRELGLLSFLKTWFRNDPDIASKVAVMGWPDFWLWANCRPVPEGLFFGGVKDLKPVDGLKLKGEFEALWEKVKPFLVSARWKGSRAIAQVDNPTDRHRLELRRHLGLIANNLGVLLQDLGHDEEAYDMYELVLGTIDCDNVCSLLNVYEMFRTGMDRVIKKDVATRKQEVEQQLKDIIFDPSRRYFLMSLAVYYGYVRSPEFFVRSGLDWARSGEAGYAIRQFKYASDLVPGGTPPKELQNMMAGLYAEGGQKELSREMYNEILKKDAANYDALMGLWKLSIMDGATDEARSYLKKAEKAKTREGVVRLEVPLQYMMDNNLVEAHEALKQIGFKQPSARVWALDAGVMLMLADKAKDSAGKQRILTEVENGILPKMEQLSDSPRDFHVQMTRAFVLMRKGQDPETVKQARAALEVAWQSRPIVAVGGMVLDMDFRLQDRESAERHAKQILRMDENHAFANWVMGSIRLSEEKLPEAERYLRASAEGVHPYARAQNDLADILRRRGSLVEAEEFARAATKTDPDLYVGWETLASTLLDSGKNLEEAERCILKALEFPEGKADPRMQLTLARVQIAKKNFVEARKTLRALGKRREELSSDRDKATLDELTEQAKGK